MQRKWRLAQFFFFTFLFFYIIFVAALTAFFLYETPPYTMWVFAIDHVAWQSLLWHHPGVLVSLSSHFKSIHCRVCVQLTVRTNSYTNESPIVHHGSLAHAFQWAQYWQNVFLYLSDALLQHFLSSVSRAHSRMSNIYHYMLKVADKSTKFKAFRQINSSQNSNVETSRHPL